MKMNIKRRQPCGVSNSIVKIGHTVFKIATGRHFGFLGRVFRLPMKNTWWSLSLCKFGWNRCSSSDMEILIFCTFGLKTPIHASQICVFWDMTPWVGWYQRNPQKVHPWAERRSMTETSLKSVHRCDLWAWRRNQKKTKKKTLRYSGKLRVSGDHPRCRIKITFGTVGGPQAVVVCFKFHPNR